MPVEADAARDHRGRMRVAITGLGIKTGAGSDLDTYWSELQEKDLERSFAGVKLRPPTEFPWGREVHIIDLAGVCWHVRQSSG